METTAPAGIRRGRSFAGSAVLRLRWWSGDADLGFVYRARTGFAFRQLREHLHPLRDRQPHRGVQRTVVLRGHAHRLRPAIARKGAERVQHAQQMVFRRRLVLVALACSLSHVPVPQLGPVLPGRPAAVEVVDRALRDADLLRERADGRPHHLAPVDQPLVHEPHVGPGGRGARTDIIAGFFSVPSALATRFFCTPGKIDRTGVNVQVAGRRCADPAGPYVVSSP